MQDLREALAVITSMEQKLHALQHDVQDKNETIKQLKKRSHRVHFDEATIAEHDKERGTRMKIDEPKTPYVREEPISFPEVADGEEEDIPVVNNVRFVVGKDKPDVSKKAETEEEEDDEDYEPVIELPPLPVKQEPQARRPLQLDIQAVNQSLQGSKKSEFEKHRAQHYNEIERLRQWRNSRANKGAEDVEEDEDEDEDENEKDASKQNDDKDEDNDDEEDEEEDDEEN